MLIDFFLTLRQAHIPVTVREFLDLLRALEHRLAFADIDDFYALSKLLMVKDEKHYDKFDRAFGAYFEGIEQLDLDLGNWHIPESWLRKQLEKVLTPEEMAKIASQGDLNALMKLFQQRLAEQKERHQGGNKWIGTGGTSPFGAFGYNPEGFRIGQNTSRHRRAVKVWDERHYRDLADDVQLDLRNMQVALRRLRVFARSGAADILDLNGTIAATAKNAGYLDVKMLPERHNAVKVLLLFDIGGSMDEHIFLCERLFSACKSEFKYLHQYYFHNCIYENLWQSNQRRHSEHTATWDFLHTYGNDYKIIIVGDATMSPYEIVYPGGSVEHMNEETGEAWLKRLSEHFKDVVWLNPVEAQYWHYAPSIKMIQQLMEGRMYPLTLSGIESAMRALM